MRNCLQIVLAIAVIVLASCTEKPVQAPEQKPGAGSSWSDAATVGTAVPTIVELSDMYVSPETYDLKVTVAEIIRGEKSGEYLKKLGASNEQVPADSESHTSVRDNNKLLRSSDLSG